MGFRSNRTDKSKLNWDRSEICLWTENAACTDSNSPPLREQKDFLDMSGASAFFAFFEFNAEDTPLKARIGRRIKFMVWLGNRHEGQVTGHRGSPFPAKCLTFRYSTPHSQMEPNRRPRYRVGHVRFWILIQAQYFHCISYSKGTAYLRSHDLYISML